jgi:hypothetical protein
MSWHVLQQRWRGARQMLLFSLHYLMVERNANIKRSNSFHNRNVGVNSQLHVHAKLPRWTGFVIILGFHRLNGQRSIKSNMNKHICSFSVFYLFICFSHQLLFCFVFVLVFISILHSKHVYVIVAILYGLACVSLIQYLIFLKKYLFLIREKV